MAAGKAERGSLRGTVGTLIFRPCPRRMGHVLPFVMTQGFQGKPRRCSLLCLKAALGILLRHCSEQLLSLLRGTPDQSQCFWQRRLPQNNVKTKLQWAGAGKPPQALEQPTMCSCPPVRVGAGRNPFHFFFLPHLSGSCHPFSREAGQAGSSLSWLWAVQSGTPWKPQEDARHRTGNKSLSGSETES